MPCTFTPQQIPGLVLVEPKVFSDERGSFAETYKLSEFSAAGFPPLVQDGESVSAKGVLRGLHYQLPPHQQAKLVRCAFGAVFDVAVDIRRDSPSFGRWFGVELSAENQKMLWIPQGFAHGFLSLAPGSKLLYKTSAEYDGPSDRGIRWNDPSLGISWPLNGQEPSLSPKDAAAPLLAEAENTFKFRDA